MPIPGLCITRCTQPKNSEKKKHMQHTGAKSINKTPMTTEDLNEDPYATHVG